MEDDHQMDYDVLLTFLKNTPANLFFKDADCRYLFLSDVGHLSPQKKERRDDILGKTDLEIWSDPERGRFYYEQDRKILATGQGIEYISEVPRDDGPGYFQIKKNPVRMDGKIVGIVGFINDITERIRLEKRLEELSVHDSLTGLYNRNYVALRGAERLKQSQLPITVIMGDCNYLKRVNDTYGHAYGDLLLMQVAHTLQEQLPPESIALRLGGDEFAMVCSHCSAQQAEALIAKIQAELARKSDDRLRLDVAFGYHTVTEGPFDYTDAYHKADRDMYRNKQLNR